MLSTRHRRRDSIALFTGVLCMMTFGISACTDQSQSGEPAGEPRTATSPPVVAAPPNEGDGSLSTTAEQQTGAGSDQVATVDPGDTAAIPGTDPSPPPRDSLQPLVIDPASGPVSNACELLDPGEPLVPAGVAQASENRTSAEFSVSTCVWGAQDSDAMLWLYIIEPGTVQDPGAFFIPQQAPASNPAPQPPGGRMWEAGFFGFGGTTVEGRSYAWSVGSVQVVLSYLGQVTPARGQALQQAVGQVDQRLQQ